MSRGRRVTGFPQVYSYPLACARAHAKTKKEPAGTSSGTGETQEVPEYGSDELELLADLIAARLEARSGRNIPQSRYLTAREVADRYGVSPAWVRAHAERLGARRLGDGPRPRLRF